MHLRLFLLLSSVNKSGHFMHPWFICRNYRLFCNWLKGTNKTRELGRCYRSFLIYLVYLMVPCAIAIAYEQTGLWSPFIGLSAEGDQITAVSLLIIGCWWTCLWLIHKAALTASFMPKPIREIWLAFEQAEVIYDTTRYLNHGIRTLFQEDLLKRTDIYLTAYRKASAEEIALSALSDIAFQHDLWHLHKRIAARLEEIEAARPRLERILTHR